MTVGIRIRPDVGSGSILVLAAAAVVGLAGLSSVAVTRALTDRHEVAGAADLVALAAASRASDCLASGRCPAGGACATAAGIARANGVLLAQCVLSGLAAGTAVADVVVERVVHWPGGTRTLRARSRAGPPPVPATQSGSGAPCSNVANRAAPPALSNGRLPLPHFGDWTQDGHPSSHGQCRIRSRVARNQRGANA